MKRAGGVEFKLKALGSFAANAQIQFRKDMSGDFNSEAVSLQLFIVAAKKHFAREGVYRALNSGGYKEWWQFWYWFKD